MNILRKVLDYINISILKKYKVYISKQGKYAYKTNNNWSYQPYLYYEIAIGIQCLEIQRKINCNILTEDMFKTIMFLIPREENKVRYLPKAWSYIEPCLQELYKYGIKNNFITNITFNKFLETYNE